MIHLKKLNSLDYETFMNMFGNVVEHCPLVAASIWNCRPFSSANEMMFAIENVVHGLPDLGKYDFKPLLDIQNTIISPVYI